MTLSTFCQKLRGRNLVWGLERRVVGTPAAWAERYALRGRGVGTTHCPVTAVAGDEDLTLAMACSVGIFRLGLRARTAHAIVWAADEHPCAHTTRWPGRIHGRAHPSPASVRRVRRALLRYTGVDA